VEGVRHTRYGWWLEEAGPVEATAPLDADTTADVAIVGGGYLGLWTAWHLKDLEPELDVVVLEAGLAGHGPSGRNGGFVSTLWDDLPILRDRVGGERALAVARASERGVRGIGEWCDRVGVDAWYRAAPTLHVATSEAQLGSSDDTIEACAELGVPEEVRPIDAEELRGRCDAGFLGGSILRTSATVHPARLALGLRAKALEAGVRLH
jgi:glycine/D-amino acid oxidase-like deaminating enzyme